VAYANITVVHKWQRHFGAKVLSRDNSVTACDPLNDAMTFEQRNFDGGHGCQRD
jgi:hypothetical protein